MLEKGVEGVAKEGRCDADIGCQAVVGLTLRKQTKGKETQQRSIGIGHKDINGVYQGGGIHGAEQQDKEHKGKTHDEMCSFAQLLILRLLTDVHTIAGRQGCQRRIGTGERGCQNAEEKESQEHVKIAAAAGEGGLDEGREQ